MGRLLLRSLPSAAPHLLGDLPLVGETFALVRGVVPRISVALSLVGRANSRVGGTVSFVSGALEGSLSRCLCRRPTIGGEVALLRLGSSNLEVDVALVLCEVSLVGRLIALVRRAVTFVGCAVTVLWRVHPCSIMPLSHAGRGRGTPDPPTRRLGRLRPYTHSSAVR